MKKSAFWLFSTLKILLCLSLIVGCAGGSLSTVHADQTPSESPISAQPKRIVVFPLFAEEILLNLVGAERIVYVGHDAWANGEAYSPAMPLTALIPGSNWQNSDEAYLLTLQPDFIILPDELEEAYRLGDLFPKILQEKIPVLFVRTPESIQEIMDMILMLGSAVGEPEKSVQMLHDMKSELEKMEAAVQSLPETARLSAVYYEDQQEGFSFISDACALHNLYKGFELTDMDDVLIASWNPDIIFFRPAWLDTDGSILSMDEQYVKTTTLNLCSNPALAQTSAVINSKVYPLHLHSSQYVVDSIKEIIRYAYPELALAIEH